MECSSRGSEIPLEHGYHSRFGIWRKGGFELGSGGEGVRGSVNSSQTKIAQVLGSEGAAFSGPWAKRNRSACDGSHPILPYSHRPAHSTILMLPPAKQVLESIQELISFNGIARRTRSTVSHPASRHGRATVQFARPPSLSAAHILRSGRCRGLDLQKVIAVLSDPAAGSGRADPHIVG
jgi:hypothetical protein